MTMPEAAVDKYGNSFAIENDIGASWQIRTVFFVSVTESANETTHDALWSSVLRLYFPHDAAALRCGKCVHVSCQSNPLHYSIQSSIVAANRPYSPHCHPFHGYISSGENWEKASGAASSKRVRRLRKTNFTLSVGPLRCLAMRSSVSSRSSGLAPALKKCGR
jgi:hypothetical protein